MDIKKPGPVKAHSFLKLNPVCKKELQSALRDKVTEVRARRIMSSLLVIEAKKAHVFTVSYYLVFSFSRNLLSYILIALLNHVQG